MINHPFKAKAVILETTIVEFKFFFEKQLREKGLDISLYVEKMQIEINF